MTGLGQFQGWTYEKVFAAVTELGALTALAQRATVVVIVLAPEQGSKRNGSHVHMEQLAWHLLGRKKVRLW